MNLIKSIKQGNYELKHHTYVDDMGIKRDTFEIIRTEKNGRKTHKPFCGLLKVKNMSRSDGYLDDTNSYTDEEYQEMFEAEKF